MHGNEDFLFLDGTAQAELVRKNAVKPLELVDASIARIERLNPTINALVVSIFEEARATAAAGTIAKGPFTGVPFLLKDFIAEYAGAPMHEGSRFLQGFIPDRDSELVCRYKRAGLIVLGKTNTPELAIGVTTEPRLFGPTHNPWDTTRSPGRIQRWFSRRGCRKDGFHGPRQRCGGLAAHPRILLRRLRVEAHPGPQPPWPQVRGPFQRSGRRTCTDTLGAGQRSPARCHGRALCGRSLSRATPCWSFPPRGIQGTRPTANCLQS